MEIYDVQGKKIKKPPDTREKEYLKKVRTAAS